MSNFPAPFQCYKPRSHKVYGNICLSSNRSVLLVKGRKTGKWSFPKGHLESNETSLQCATRELFEETGIALNGMSPLGYKKLVVGGYFAYLFDQELPLEIQDTKEVECAEWVPLSCLAYIDRNVDVSVFHSRMERMDFHTFFNIETPIDESPRVPCNTDELLVKSI